MASDNLVAAGVGFAAGTVVVGLGIYFLLPKTIEADAAAIGEAAGRNYISRVYGLTPERIAGMQRLGQYLSPLGNLF